MNNGSRSVQFPNAAPAAQIWFRHTTLLTPKLAQALNHATRGRQVSFAVATWRLGIPSSVSNFANTRLSRRGHPKLENVLEAPPRGESARSGRRRASKRNRVLHFKAARLLNVSFYCWHSRHTRKGVHGEFENADGGGRAKQKQHNNQPTQRSHNNAWRRTDEMQRPFVMNLGFCCLIITFTTQQRWEDS